jgi:hypothetical protein
LLFLKVLDESFKTGEGSGNNAAGRPGAEEKARIHAATQRLVRRFVETSPNDPDVAKFRPLLDNEKKTGTAR